MRCTCPVCGMDAEYFERYAHKWHKCRAGCTGYPGTRLILIPDGVGVPEAQIAANWRKTLRRGKASRWLVAAAGATLIPAPLLASVVGISWATSVGVAAVGAFVAGAASHSARTFYINRPAGLSAEPIRAS